MKLDVNEYRSLWRRKEKCFNYRGTILADTYFSYSYGYFKLFPKTKPWVFAREIILQHEIERTLCFHFLLEEGRNIQNRFNFVPKNQT